jgi:hypothetical protein
MASTTQEKVFESFVAASGGQSPRPKASAAWLADVVKQAGEIQRSSVTPAKVSTSATTATSGGNTAASIVGDIVKAIGGGNIGAAIAGGSGGSSSGGAGSIASTVLKSGLGIVPLISGLLGLFGGGGSPAPPPLVKYAMPASIDFQAAETQSGVQNADYDQTGNPRSYGSGAAAPSSSPTPQITVNVQAMDSRSFLDHSNEIAHAVRDAMLNLNAINDVVNEL